MPDSAASMPDASSASMGPLQFAALASAVVGGGVVGLDYAKWFKTDPLIGFAIGAAIMCATAALLRWLKKHKERVSAVLMQIGAVVGFITACVLIAKLPGMTGVHWLLGLAGGIVFGILAGSAIACLLDLLVVLLLFLSEGPVGLFLRNIVLPGVFPNQNPPTFSSTQVTHELMELVQQFFC